MAQLLGWLFLCAIMLWIVLCWCGVAQTPNVLVVLFSIGMYLLLSGVPSAWPWKPKAA